jgi:hypothetical protein
MRDMSHVPFGAYQQHVQRVLRALVNHPIPAEWWEKQTLPDGNHRTWLHYKMGLGFDESAEELRPFAEAQLLKPQVKGERWQDCCSEWTKDGQAKSLTKKE